MTDLSTVSTRELCDELAKRKLGKSNKKYKCLIKHHCNQFKKQGNKATRECEGCSSLVVTEE